MSLATDTLDADVADGVGQDTYEDARDAETTLGSDQVWEPVSETESPEDTSGDGAAPRRARDSAGRFVKEGTDDDSGLDPQVLDMARRVYGYADEDLEGFASTEELERALRLADRQMQPAWQQPQQPQAPQTQQPPQQLGQQTQPAAEDPLSKIDLSSLDEDDPIRLGFEAMRSELSAMRQGFQQQQQYIQQQQQAEGQRIYNSFSTSLSDFLGELDGTLYGKPGSRSVAQQRLVQEVEQPAIALISQRLQAGESLDSLDMKPFFRAAATAVHHGRLTSQTQQRHPQADLIARRSKARSGASSRNHISKTNIPKDLDGWDPLSDEETNAKIDEVFQRAANR